MKNSAALDRIEPDIDADFVDDGVCALSVAISSKRIADASERTAAALEWMVDYLKNQAA
jgi:hypothetical protein